MFEYWFKDVDDPDSPGKFIGHHGTTHDFLEICSQIAEKFSPSVVGGFVSALMEDKKSELAYLRVVEWKFNYKVPFAGPYPDYEPDDEELEAHGMKFITLHKLR